MTEAVGGASDWYGEWIYYLQDALEVGLSSLWNDLVAPGAAQLGDAFPPLRRALAPLLWWYQAATGTYTACYNFVHDEIVPTAMELADRLPLFGAVLARFLEPPGASEPRHQH